jgi:hypothetical protein
VAPNPYFFTSAATNDRSDLLQSSKVNTTSLSGIDFNAAPFSPAFDFERISPKVVIKRTGTKDIFMSGEVSFLPLRDNPAFLFGEITSKYEITITL